MSHSGDRERFVAVHEFVYATPAAPPQQATADEGEAPATKTAKRQGHNYVQVNRVDISSGSNITLRDVLGDDYSPLTLVGNDRFRQLLPLIGMPTTNE